MLRQTYRTVARRTTKDSTTFRPCHQEHIGSWYRNLHSLLSSKRHVELHAQDEIKLNFSMEVGSVIESVTVAAGAPLIQAGPQLGGTFLSREIRDLPLVSMNPISLARTLPGAVDPAGSWLFATGLYPDKGEATLFPVNGQRPRANNYLLD